jgi:hypothetical protein
MERARFRLGEGMIGHVAATGEPYVSAPGDEGRFLRWVVETEDVASFMQCRSRSPGGCSAC